MQKLKMFTVALILAALGGCLSFSSNKGTPGPQGAQGAQGDQGAQGATGSSDKIIVVPERRY